MSKVWRTGPHRAKFITQSVWDLKQSLESVGSGLVVRVGLVADVVKALLDGFKEREDSVGAVWMTGEEGVEERRDQRAVSALCKKLDTDFKLWSDEKYYVDELVNVFHLVPFPPNIPPLVPAVMLTRVLQSRCYDAYQRNSRCVYHLQEVH